MAKDREKIEDKANEPVANCDQLPMAADIQPMIRVIRGCRYTADDSSNQRSASYY